MSKIYTGAQIRQAFLDYFKSKGHQVVDSSPLVPQNDPTLLFANAGMNQFKEIFIGAEERPYKRATTCQKCVRVSGKHNDFENVGVTARHHTFFEMLGNFSFGDYFKEDAIKFAWDFVTEVLQLDKSRLWVTIFEKDDEAASLWAKNTDVRKERILRLGEKDNFWAMWETGPCGPCSEIHYFIDKDSSRQTEKVFREDDGSFLEIWNLVFMQYVRLQNGRLEALPKPSIDTGAGLERIASILQGVHSNYDCDLVCPIIATCEDLSGFKYDGSSYKIMDLKKDVAYARDVAMRAIADHSRAVAFLIADGVNPSNDGRGYVLRRILRRAVRHGRILNFKEPFFVHTIDTVIRIFEDTYPVLREKAEFIKKVADAEERKFHETLEAGMSVLIREVEKLGSTAHFSGETAFLLHDTYGFPLDLTEDALKAYGKTVDHAAFHKAMEEQRSRSREDRKAQNISFSNIKIDGEKTRFLGYESLESESKLVEILLNEGRDRKQDAKQIFNLIFDSTPFYAESGGQVGDTGIIHFDDARLEVLDTQKIQDAYYVHVSRLVDGVFSEKKKGAKAILKVDAARRKKIMANHSTAHLLQAALKQVLGEHVRQSGSRVDERSLRFDYSHFEALSNEQLLAIQYFINEEIRKNHVVETKILPIEEAKQLGAIALFGEKYGDIVRIVKMGDCSLEFCGGTHVRQSGDIGLALIASDSGIAAGIRRIECYSGQGAIETVLSERAERAAIADLLKGEASGLYEKVEKALARIKSLEKELESMRARYISTMAEEIASKVQMLPSGLKIVVERVDDVDVDTLRGIVDDVRSRIKSGVVALSGAVGLSGVLIAGVTGDLSKKIHVGSIVKKAAEAAHGKGGGRPDFAQAGGLDPSLVSHALQRFNDLLREIQ
ncbi:MAG: alanine--tRNA ligase [SAR324 cluster bacterium]|uniref:Alanine--tRNA ligase n=1 Tax=SAR324 cluster bacterium TaxID=2024889 RepID=A0A7X9FSZ4_9DELT|nr:alanine--tRNA ligase [SAR324 cluster bacterium]